MLLINCIAMASLGARCFAVRSCWSQLNFSHLSLTGQSVSSRNVIQRGLRTTPALLVQEGRGMWTRKPRKVHNVQADVDATRVLEENASKRKKPRFPTETLGDEFEAGSRRRDSEGRMIYPTENGEIKYKIIGVEDNTFVNEMKSFKKTRRNGTKIILEGKRLINDAILAGVKVEKIFFCHVDVLDNLESTGKQSVQFFKVYDRSMNTWSELTTPPGIIAICEKPDTNTIIEQQKNLLPLIVLCDNVREPGNMGSIIRSVAAAGCRMLITTKGCVNVWDGKVLRSASGAHFHMPIFHSIDWSQIRNYLPEHFKVFLADNIGSEQETTLMGKPKKTSRNKPKVFHNEWEETVLEDGESELKNSNSFTNPEELAKYAEIKLSTEFYPQIHFPPNLPSVLVIGGETMGLSLASRKLAHEHDGKLVSIPLCNNIDSLNAGVACGILAYEMRRQFSGVKDNVPGDAITHEQLN